MRGILDDARQNIISVILISKISRGRIAAPVPVARKLGTGRRHFVRPSDATTRTIQEPWGDGAQMDKNNEIRDVERRIDTTDSIVSRGTIMIITFRRTVRQIVVIAEAKKPRNCRVKYDWIQNETVYLLYDIVERDRPEPSVLYTDDDFVANYENS